MKHYEACGFFLNDILISMKNCTLRQQTFKVLMDSELSSPGPRTFQGNTRTPCDSNTYDPAKFE